MERGAGRWRFRAAGLRLALGLLLGGCLLPIVGGVAIGAQDEAATTLRMVHGVAGGEALDLYVDGAAAILAADFASASDEIAVAAGERRLVLTRSGAGAEAEVVAGTVELTPGSAYLAAVLGEPDAVRLFLYEIDRSPLAAGDGRLRVVHGLPDAGPLDVAITGGDVLLPTVEYPSGTEYADVEAAAYDLELRAAESGGVVLALPATEVAAGEVLDLVAVGAVGDGSLLVVAVESAVEVEVASESGIAASLRSGGCSDPGEVVAAIGPLAAAEGEAVGGGGGLAVASGFGVVPLPFEEVVGGESLIAVVADEGGSVVACGVIGGRVGAEGALTVGLAGGEGLAGIVVVGPGLADPATTEVSVLYAGGGGTEQVAEAEGDGEAAERDALVAPPVFAVGDEGDEAAATPAP